MPAPDGERASDHDLRASGVDAKMERQLQIAHAAIQALKDDGGLLTFEKLQKKTGLSSVALNRILNDPAYQQVWTRELHRQAQDLVMSSLPVIAEIMHGSAKPYEKLAAIDRAERIYRTLLGALPKQKEHDARQKIAEGLRLVVKPRVEVWQGSRDIARQGPPDEDDAGTQTVQAEDPPVPRHDGDEGLLPRDPAAAS